MFASSGELQHGVLCDVCATCLSGPLGADYFRALDITHSAPADASQLFLKAVVRKFVAGHILTTLRRQLYSV